MKNTLNMAPPSAQITRQHVSLASSLAHEHRGHVHPSIYPSDTELRELIVNIHLL